MHHDFGTSLSGNVGAVKSAFVTKDSNSHIPHDSHNDTSFVFSSRAPRGAGFGAQGGMNRGGMMNGGMNRGGMMNGGGMMGNGMNGMPMGNGGPTIFLVPTRGVGTGTCSGGMPNGMVQLPSMFSVNMDMLTAITVATRMRSNLLSTFL